MRHVSVFLQGAAVDDVPLLRVAHRPSPASGLKATSSGSLAVALPDGRQRYERLENLPSLHLGGVAFCCRNSLDQQDCACLPAAYCESSTLFGHTEDVSMHQMSCSSTGLQDRDGS